MATATSRKLFVNLAVKDLGRAVDFFTQLGFSFDPTFTDDQATCMILSEDAYVMLLVEERFKDFTTKELADPGAETEASSRSPPRAGRRSTSSSRRRSRPAAGRRRARRTTASCTRRGFEDPDGHLWEVLWMDPGALAQ